MSEKNLVSYFKFLLLAALILPLVPAGTSPGPCLAGEEPGGEQLADEKIIGLSFRGRHRAYPLKFFFPPMVVNDRIRQQEVAVFHDPDQGVSTAYFRMVLGEPIVFSGTVVGSLAEDLTTITRWDMVSGKAVSGNLLGLELISLPVTRTSWSEWLAAHPDTTVFSPGKP